MRALRIAGILLQAFTDCRGLLDLSGAFSDSQAARLVIKICHTPSCYAALLTCNAVHGGHEQMHGEGSSAFSLCMSGQGVQPVQKKHGISLSAMAEACLGRPLDKSMQMSR